MNKTKAMDLLDKFKYPLLIFVLGVILMLLPTGSAKSEEAEGNERIQQMLSSVEGVGEAQVIISDNGVVVV